MERLRISPATPMSPANRKAAPIALIVFALVTLLGISLGEEVASPPQDPLHQEITNYKTDESGVFVEMQKLSRRYRVPLGIEADSRWPDAKHVSVTISRGTVADIFNALVQHVPDYKWVESSGVVNVMPRQGSGGVLDVTIARFRANKATPDAIVAAIGSSPEVKAWVSQNRIVERDFFTPSILVGKGGKTDQPRVSLSVKNATLRDILNTIVKKPGFHVWLVGRYGEHSQYLSISVD
jgi:hypothetical protein